MSIQQSLPEIEQRHPPVLTISAIAVGAIIGSTARFLIGNAIAAINSSEIPLGTLLVNLVGCFLIGVAQTLFQAGRLRYLDLLRPGITVGLLGSFTTFSTFSIETIRLLQRDHAVAALVYQSLSLTGGLGAVVLGAGVAGWLCRSWQQWTSR